MISQELFYQILYKAIEKKKNREYIVQWQNIAKFFSQHKALKNNIVRVQ